MILMTPTLFIAARLSRHVTQQQFKPHPRVARADRA
jgi:hypothetical protein